MRRWPTSSVRSCLAGGVLLTNNQILELPPTPIGGVGYADVTYMALPGLGETGDRVVWCQRQ